MSFRTPHERRLWLAAGVGLLVIYASAYFVQFVLLFLRARGWLGPTILAAFLLVAGVVVAAVARQRPGRAEILLLVAAAGVYALLFRHLTIIQERIHLLQYGALGALFYTALLERWPPPRPGGARWHQRQPGLLACLLAGLAGWGDELVQGVLPNRVYDLRDVALNAASGALVVGVLAARRRLRAAPPARSRKEVATSRV
jgi:hypothetical protein